MRWEDEQWIKVYTRDTADWLALSYDARSLFLNLLRKVDRAGLLPLGRHGKRAVAIIVGAPELWEERIAPALDELLDDGCVRIEGGGLIIPNFVAAQEARQTDRARKAAQRARDRDQAVASSVTAEPEVRDNTGSESEGVTRRHTASHGVTNRREETRVEEKRDPPNPPSGGEGTRKPVGPVQPGAQKGGTSVVPPNGTEGAETELPPQCAGTAAPSGGLGGTEPHRPAAKPPKTGRPLNAPKGADSGQPHRPATDEEPLPPHSQPQAVAAVRDERGLLPMESGPPEPCLILPDEVDKVHRAEQGEGYSWGNEDERVAARLLSLAEREGKRGDEAVREICRRFANGLRRAGDQYCPGAERVYSLSQLAQDVRWRANAKPPPPKSKSASMAPAAPSSDFSRKPY